jgi:hypothetical protein
MDVEERAKTMGWVTMEDFKGDPDKWTSAEDYVDKADNIMPIMRAQNRKYEEELKAKSIGWKKTEEELAALKKTVENIVRINTNVSEREYERAMETIRNEQATAIENNDGEKFKALEAQKDTLVKNRPEKVEIVKEDPPVNPEFTKWVTHNTWYNDDPELRNYSDYMASVVSRENPQLEGEALFEAVKNRVKATFPDKFENPNRNKAGDVDGGTNQGGSGEKKNKSYRDLPADARSACDRFVAEGLMTREEYAKDYFEEE